MTGMASMAHADNAEALQKDIQKSVQTTIQRQADLGLFTETSDITVKIVKPQKIVEIDKKTKKKIEREELDLSENHTIRVGELCKMTLSFDELGNLPYLGHDNQLMKLTQLQNEKQKDIARKFVALHEHSHCEFSSIKDPIQLSSATPEFNKKINYFLKETEVVNVDWGSGGKELNYIKTLNESYSDVSAMVILMKEYGANDPDLKFVLKALEAQRHDSYLQKGANEHNTHVAIETLMKPENIAQIKGIDSDVKLKSFSLKMANEGVQTLMAERKEFVENGFTQENFTYSVMINMLRIIKYNIDSEEERKQYQPTIWKEGIEPGLAYEVAKEFLSDIDLSKYNFDNKKEVPGKQKVMPIDFTTEIMLKPAESKVMENIYKQYKETTNEFKEAVYKEHTQVIDFGKDISKEDIMKRVNSLRTKFIEDTKEDFKMKGPMDLK